MNDDITVTELTEDGGTATEPLSSGPISIDLEPIQKFFFGRSDDVTNADKEDMAVMWKYFSDQSQGHGEALGKLRDLERGLATPPPGVSRLQHIAAYVRLLVSEQDLQREKSAYL